MAKKTKNLFLFFLVGSFLLIACATQSKSPPQPSKGRPAPNKKKPESRVRSPHEELGALKIYASAIEIGKLEEHHQADEFTSERAVHTLYEFASRGAERFFTLETAWGYQAEAEFDDLTMLGRFSLDSTKNLVTYFKKMQVPDDNNLDQRQLNNEKKFLNKTRAQLQVDAFIKMLQQKGLLAQPAQVQQLTNDSFVIAAVTPPEKLSLQGVSLRLWNFYRTYQEVTWPNGVNQAAVVVKKPGKVLFSDPKLGEFYRFGSALSLKLPDGTFAHYMVEFSGLFEKLKTLTGDSYDCFESPPKRDWSPEYARFRLIVVPSGTQPALWTSFEGFKVFTVPRPVSESLSYIQLRSSLEETDKRPPYIHIQDPFGRVVECFNSTRVEPLLAEPLIYLYPQKTAVVRVSFDPSIHLVKVIPDFNLQAGWQVHANHLGQLKVSGSSQGLRYLFWEGYSKLLPPAKEGFVFKASEVLQELPKILDHFALSSPEKEDFVRYWSQRLTYAPYYQLYFYPQDQIHRIAPINITPRPNQFIRVLMEVIPHYREVQVPRQVLPSLKRSSGFTVIEWGGFIR